jgi:hypothetical protein
MLETITPRCLHQLVVASLRLRTSVPRGGSYPIDFFTGFCELRSHVFSRLRRHVRASAEKGSLLCSEVRFLLMCAPSSDAFHLQFKAGV